MDYASIVQGRGLIARWPEFAGDRIYMLPFKKAEGLPVSAERWQGVVNDMLEGVDSDEPIYLMVDQALVPAGKSHRRPGVHIDGYWGGSGWSHISAHGGSPDGGGPRHRAYDTPTPSRHNPSPTPSHRAAPPVIDRHTPATPTRHGARQSDWGLATFEAPEAIILASNFAACRGYSGRFKGPVGDMGDCSDIDLTGMLPTDMEIDAVYAGNVSMLHETLPCAVDAFRTVVRLNVPGWSPQPSTTP